MGAARSSPAWSPRRGPWLSLLRGSSQIQTPGFSFCFETQPLVPRLTFAAPLSVCHCPRAQRGTDPGPKGSHWGRWQAWPCCVSWWVSVRAALLCARVHAAALRLPQSLCAGTPASQVCPGKGPEAPSQRPSLPGPVTRPLCVFPQPWQEAAALRPRAHTRVVAA